MVQKHIRRGIVMIASLAVLGVAIPPSAANAADGPIDLGFSESFAVLGGSAVTFAASGTTVVAGDIGVSPGSSITGLENVSQSAGTIYHPPSIADDAHADLIAAYNVAAGLTPTQSGLVNLSGSLPPGVYSGVADQGLAVDGTLTLAGDADSYWLFQADSTLLISDAAEIIVTGGAGSCNVFWQVGTSTTIQGGAKFVGTVMANAAITVTAGADIQGRLLALNAAVTLDNDTITRPTGCSTTGGDISTSPTITSPEPPSGIEGTGYSYTVTASGTPTPTYTTSAGALPPGLALDATTGVISGTPTAAGSYTFTVTASNGTAPDTSATYTVAIAVTSPSASTPAGSDEPEGELAVSGTDSGAAPLGAAALLGLGMFLVLMARRSARLSR